MSDATTVQNPHRVEIQLPRDEYDNLLSKVEEPRHAEGGSERYAQNSAVAEHVRHLLSEHSEVDLSDYEATAPSSRSYSRKIYLQLPESEHEALREEFSTTPIADDHAGRGCYAGNSQFAEWCRRVIQHHLDETDDEPEISSERT